MLNFEKRISSDFLLRLLFHVIFWFYWLILPILNVIIDEDQKRYDFLIQLLPATIACIPFFYFNTEYLVKRFLPTGKITSYVISLLLLFVVFLISQYFLKIYIITDRPVRIYDTRTLFPVLFIISMSTLYGLIIFMVGQQKRNKDQEEVRLKTELSFLRSQISPHFIFNVLNSIVYLIKKEPANAEKVTLELSNLLRYMLYESEYKQVTLQKEIEYLENYIKLQNIRFGDDVEINLNLAQHTENLYIEPMLLIPFVENAFKHGVGMVKKPVIDIDLKLEKGNQLIFSVKNFKSKTKEKIVDSQESGIGLKNVKRRVELLYANQHKFEVNDFESTFEVILELELKNLML
jgi:two-component system, LytTR family, sensor kinase